MTSVAVLGTGLLGTAIATRLLEQGLNVHVWNRDPSRIGPLLDKGAMAIDEPAEAAGENRVIVTVLRDGAATAAVISAVGPLHDQRRNRWEPWEWEKATTWPAK